MEIFGETIRDAVPGKETKSQLTSTHRQPLSPSTEVDIEVLLQLKVLSIRVAHLGCRKVLSSVSRSGYIVHVCRIFYLNLEPRFCELGLHNDETLNEHHKSNPHDFHSIYIIRQVTSNETWPTPPNRIGPIYPRRSQWGNAEY